MPNDEPTTLEDLEAMTVERDMWRRAHTGLLDKHGIWMDRTAEADKRVVEAEAESKRLRNARAQALEEAARVANDAGRRWIAREILELSTKDEAT